ncbi:MAG: Crp/Fnr family transcriptional regulator [Candidatus Omnitrophica bacterium]|nr:Crp/Fnr family transcriptional regulator [Candidatus Omnitrophota bacterium]
MAMVLREVPLFQGLLESEFELIRGCLIEKAFRKREMLFHEGSPCERIFIVREGRVKLYRTSSSGREQILEVLGPGDTCACNPGSRAWFCASSAEALTPCKAWFLSRDHYVRMVQTNSGLSHALNKIFAERLHCFSALIEEVSLKDTKKRLVKFLLDMLEESATQAAGRDALLISFTREEIAQRIGAARETVARCLSQLKRSRLIDVRPRQIVIRDRAGLEKLL